MASTPTLDVFPSKLTKKRSFKDKLFLLHHDNKQKTKPRPKRAQSCGNPQGKKSWHLLQISSTSDDTKHQQRPSKLGIFFHDTFEKLSNSPPFRSLSPSNNSHSEETLKIIMKSRWKPSLETIYKDSELLSALIKFMERSYNAELILFLQSVHQLKTSIDACINDEEKEAETDINRQIISIFHEYIAPTAEYQVNLSYECFLNTTKFCQPPMLSTFSINDKKKIFEQAVTEIQMLMITSVLALFYDSDEFQVVAQSKSPNYSPVTPPIVLSMSRSTPAIDDDGLSSENDDDFENDELVFLDKGYMKSLNI